MDGGALKELSKHICGRNYGAIKLDLGEVSGLMLFPAKSVDHWGHIMPTLVVL